ncbi:MAG: FtsW/RodA/SpoVE family cell cycle protein [Prolixibacteraceae bacterium]
MNFSDYFSRLKGDRTLWMVVLILSLFSILIVYSSTGALAFRKLHGNTSYYILRQVAVQAMGFMIIMLMVKYQSVKFYNKIANPVYLIALFLVVLGIVFGRADGGSGRTVHLGPISFQPAEFAKIAIVLWVARILSVSKDDPDSQKITFLRIISGVGLLGGLLILVNFSSAFLVVSTAFIMMYVGRVKILYMASVIGIAIALLFVQYTLKDRLPDIVYKMSRLDTVNHRIDAFLGRSDKVEDEGVTQAEFAKIAIYRGGIFGVGAGKSDISNRMSAAYNDFVYSIIVEEYGILGGAGIMLLYLILLTRGLAIIRGCKRTFPLFLATGVVTLIMLQAMINMGVSSGLIPVTGQPLPWVSWGGTSQLFTAIAFGFLFKVSAENKAESLTEIVVSDDSDDADEEVDEEFSREDLLKTLNKKLSV